MQRCPRGRRSMIGNHVYGYTVPRVRIPLSAPKQKALRMECFLFWREGIEADRKEKAPEELF